MANDSGLAGLSLKVVVYLTFIDNPSSSSCMSLSSHFGRSKIEIPVTLIIILTLFFTGTRMSCERRALGLPKRIWLGARLAIAVDEIRS